jgi:alkylhydroperoxidase family enzyme
MSSTDCSKLRSYGYTDEQILEATHIVGFFNHINRVADALGVDPEPEWGENGES